MSQSYFLALTSDFKAETKRRMELELDCDLLKKGIAEKELLEKPHFFFKLRKVRNLFLKTIFLLHSF